MSKAFNQERKLENDELACLTQSSNGNLQKLRPPQEIGSISFPIFIDNSLKLKNKYVISDDDLSQTTYYKSSIPIFYSFNYLKYGKLFIFCYLE